MNETLWNATQPIKRTEMSDAMIGFLCLVYVLIFIIGTVANAGVIHIIATKTENHSVWSHYNLFGYFRFTSLAIYTPPNDPRYNQSIKEVVFWIHWVQDITHYFSSDALHVVVDSCDYCSTSVQVGDFYFCLHEISLWV